MRKIVVGAMVSLDGVMQAPGGPDEDPTGGFAHGGWVAPFWDDVLGEAIGESFAQPFDLLLGRTTYDIFAAYWPHIRDDPSASEFNEMNVDIARKFNRATKHVATHRPDTLGWRNSRALAPDTVAALRELRQGEGPPLLTQGSTELLALLFENDLVDELRLTVFPLVLGKGKRLFGDGSIPKTFRLAASKISTTGVIVATYERAGTVESGSFAMDEPAEAELERRRRLRRV